MMKNKIFAILISLSLVIFYGCASPAGGSLASQNPEGMASITITVQDGNDFTVTKSENSGTVTLTCESGYSDFKWYVDGSSEVVSEAESYSFSPVKGVSIVFVKAKKNGAVYSATFYVSKQ